MQKIELDALRNVHGLSLPKTIDGRELTALMEIVNHFIETLPDESREMLRLFVSGNYGQLARKLEKMSDALVKLYAFDAMEQSHHIVELINSEDAKNSDLDPLLNRLIGELSTLSIDIQVAQYQTGDHTYHRADSDSDVKHIFAVDDVPIILNTLKRFLDSDKYKFSGITSGKAALRYLETREIPPDMIVLDIDMPEMDGFVLAVKIKEMLPDIPIMFLTSNATREAVVSAFQVGAIDFIVKPLNKQLILRKLDKYLG